ncbi:MAG: hypoxanthine phosphoribosyltransferase [Gammaproteobacteria bacterium]|nr:MAG: hypoxanthine phosphoribosyltransferase [Gammaproteobacteria bacterium]TND07005.1 MAG: hypoxanthine phosphoribosyltransferase [Gammaproteobacteria bacterium]
MMTPEQALAVHAEADCLYSASQVETALDSLGTAISGKLAGTNPLLLCVLTGGMVPMGMLLPRLDFPLHIDYIHATRYGGDTSGGEVRWIARPTTPVKERVVLLIDDILDEGVTLKTIRDECLAAGAIAVYIAVLVNKLHERKNGMEADFVGLDVEDRYVFGYGMDYKGYLRNANGIFAVKEHA